MKRRTRPRPIHRLKPGWDFCDAETWCGVSAYNPPSVAEIRSLPTDPDTATCPKCLRAWRKAGSPPPTPNDDGTWMEGQP